MDMILKLETDLERCRTESEVRAYYRSLDKGEQDMDMVIDMCYKRLLETRNRKIKRGDLLGCDW